MVRPKIKRYWALIIVFSCLTAYLIFPTPLDRFAFILFPSDPLSELREIQFTKLSYNVSTEYDIVSLNIIITNNDIVTHNYAIFTVIGNNASGLWYGPNHYRDGLVPSTDVQNVINNWYGMALICTGPLNPYQSFQITRKIEFQNDLKIKDSLIIVYDKNDASKELVRGLKLNVINSEDALN